MAQNDKNTLLCFCWPQSNHWATYFYFKNLPRVKYCHLRCLASILTGCGVCGDRFPRFSWYLLIHLILPLSLCHCGSWWTLLQSWQALMGIWEVLFSSLGSIFLGIQKSISSVSNKVVEPRTPARLGKFLLRKSDWTHSKKLTKLHLHKHILKHRTLSYVLSCR